MIYEFLFSKFIEYQYPDIALNSNCSIPVHPVTKRTNGPPPDELQRSPSCFKESKNYYPDCFNEYGDAFTECESSSNCVGIIKLISNERIDHKDYRHAPGGYYLCRENFTISERFFDSDSQNYQETIRSKELYKKKKGKGILYGVRDV